MLYWIKDGRYYPTKCSAPAGAQPHDVPHDHKGLMDYLNNFGVIARSSIQGRSSPGKTTYQTDEDRMKIALDRCLNLTNFEVESAEDFLRKIRRGNFVPTPKQSNLMDKIYDKAMRRANFRNEIDHYA